jgi:Uncharacterized protein conserved in bacteria (DUF2325)
MRVGIIGGTEKNLVRYEELAETLGCEVEFHDGRMAGRGSEALDSLVFRCDLVVIITQINSHAAVRMAQKACRKHARRVLITRRFGLHSFVNTVRNPSPELSASL